MQAADVWLLGGSRDERRKLAVRCDRKYLCAIACRRSRRKKPNHKDRIGLLKYRSAIFGTENM